MTGPKPPVDQRLLDEAVAVSRAAGALTLRWFASDSLTVDAKGDGTPVTQADRAAERLVRERLADTHPEDAVLGEEEDDQPGSSGRTWIVDPIDGTKAFTRGIPLYSSLLAVVDEHGPAIGVIDLPALGHTVWAGRGLGCFLDGRPARVSDRVEAAEAVLSSSDFTGWGDEALLAVKHAGFQLRTWGDGFGYAMVATGAIEAMVDPAVSLWDVAPMPVILHEAGGRFTDTAGLEPTLTPGRPASGVATNGHVHDRVVRCLTPEP
jgi:histidinol phosphatase-like enzyme (inositol monophosphatase family)